jgi:hypothetical protein
MKSFFSFIAAMVMATFIVGCTTNSFLPVHEYGDAKKNGRTLGQRTVSDPHAFAPGTQRSWMEVCERKVTAQKSGTFTWTETEYIQPCTFTAEQPGTNFVTYSPYVNGMATPLIQAGAILGASALLADGIRDSAARTSNTNGNTNSNSATNSNSNSNSNNANGGQGGAGGNGQGGNGGAGGNGGNGGNAPGCQNNNPNGC